MQLLSWMGIQTLSRVIRVRALANTAREFLIIIGGCYTRDMNILKHIRPMRAVFCMSPVLLCLWGCGNTSTSAPENITGLKRLATEERFVASFNSVEFNPAGIVNLTFGTAQKVTVTVNENLMEYITTTVSGGVLAIGVAPGIQIKNLNLTFDLVMTDLERLVMNGAGNFFGKNLFQVDSTTLNLNGAGGIALQIAADELKSILMGAGTITLNGNVTTHSIEIRGRPKSWPRSCSVSLSREPAMSTTGGIPRSAWTLRAPAHSSTTIDPPGALIVSPKSSYTQLTLYIHCLFA